MSYRVRNIVLAVGLALLAALLTTFYVTNYKKRVQSQQETVQVLVASQDILPGTPGSKVVQDGMLRTREVARQAVVPGAISSPKQIQSLIATQPVYAGEQVTGRRFGPVAAAGVRSRITGTYRVVQVPGDANQLLIGTLKPGDHVDFLGNIKIPGESDSKHFARIVLRDLVVLKVSAASSGASKLTSGSQKQDWVMLRVTDAQSQKLFFTYVNEEWTLALRPTLNAADSPNSFEDSFSVLEAGIKDAARKILQAFSLAAQLDAADNGGGTQ